MIGRILLPAVLPAWVVALRTGLGLGFMFVVAAALIGASEGLAYLLVDGQQLGKPDQILAALIFFAIVGQACDGLLLAVPCCFGRTRIAGPLDSEALEQVDRLDQARRWPRDLSGGQQQRIALARALVTRIQSRERLVRQQHFDDPRKPAGPSSCALGALSIEDPDGDPRCGGSRRALRAPGRFVDTRV